MSMKKISKQKITFSLNAPEAREVQLLGDFSGWEQNPIDLKKLRDGRWKATLSLAEGKYEYRYRVDGQWHDDPDCPMRTANSFGSENCVRVVS